MKTPHRDDFHKKKQEMLFTGPMTLTSLMSKDKENKASDHIYLQLDSLFKEDVFVSIGVLKAKTLCFKSWFKTWKKFKCLNKIEFFDV